MAARTRRARPVAAAAVPVALFRGTAPAPLPLLVRGRRAARPAVAAANAAVTVRTLLVLVTERAPRLAANGGRHGRVADESREPCPRDRRAPVVGSIRAARVKKIAVCIYSRECHQQ